MGNVKGCVTASDSCDGDKQIRAVISAGVCWCGVSQNWDICITNWPIKMCKPVQIF